MKRSQSVATLLLFSAIHLFTYAESSTFNLQDAIDDADRRDTIIVPKGTYTQPIAIDKQLTLVGEGAIIEVLSDLPAIKIDTSKLVTLKNLEIRYQPKEQNGKASKGLSAVCCAGGDLLIENCTFKSTRTTSACAVHSTYNSTLQIKESRFDGLGIRIDDGSETIVEDCMIQNSAIQGIVGGRGGGDRATS